jgi:hypothetical protein
VTLRGGSAAAGRCRRRAPLAGEPARPGPLLTGGVMIYLLVGDLGSGKTIKVLPWMESAVRAGRYVATNIQLTEKCWFHDRVALIGSRDYPVALEDDEPAGKYGYRYFWQYVPKGALIVIDEADIWFDSSAWGDFGKACKWYHKMVRKFKHDVVYIVQRSSNLYKRIRDLAGRTILCENTYRTKRIFRYFDRLLGEERSRLMSRFIYWEFSDPECRGVCRGEGHFTYEEASRYFGWYDTEQMLGDSQQIVLGTLPEGRQDDDGELNNGNAGSGDAASRAGAGRRRRRHGARGNGPALVTAAAGPVEEVGGGRGAGAGRDEAVWLADVGQAAAGDREPGSAFARAATDRAEEGSSA